MGHVKLTIDLFLCCISASYLCAFASLYVQIPGLYGNNGLLPVRLVLPTEPNSLNELQQSPTILRYLHRLGFDAESGMDFCCLVGITLSFAALVWKWFRNSVIFFAIWILYLSVYHVGQTFLWFQWDILLLEVGFLTVILAPFTWSPVSRWKWFHQHDSITFWLVKWLLFRLMFSSGVVKLTSGCQTWWGLTALTYHYETQCIPTPLAWYFHQLPDWFQTLSVAAVFVIQLVFPFLFFSPSSAHRILAGFGQVLLMVLIILTGNYNFFNWLTIALCLPLLNDSFFKTKSDDKRNRTTSAVSTDRFRYIRLLVHFIVYGSLLYITVHYFSISLNFKQLQIDSAIAFTMSDLEQFLHYAVPISIWIGILALAVEICSAFVRCLRDEIGAVCKITNLLGCIVFGIIASIVFLISLVPYSVIDQPTRDILPVAVKHWHSSTRDFQLTSSYGLFRHMTGVGGRPEVIIQGSNSLDADEWLEYEFLYKPGDVSRRPPVVAPHQPRLDWQMWFAALGSYQHNPWFLNLIYRLLTNEKTVVELIAKNPFVKEPPRYMRALLYHYHYTALDGRCNSADGSPADNGTWWCRKFVQEYLPIVSTTEPNFVDYLKRAGIYEDFKSTPNLPDNLLTGIVRSIRSLVGQADGYQSCVSLLTTALALIFINKKLFHQH